MNYIKRSTHGVAVYGKENKVYNKGLIDYVNTLCIRNMSTFQGRKEAVSKLLLSKTNLPIYVNEDVILYPTKSLREYDSILINYHNVLSFRSENEGTKIIFKDLSMLDLTENSQKIEKQHKKVKNILNHLISMKIDEN